MSSEIKLITTLQEDNKQLRAKNTELKKELENFSKPTLKTRHDLEMHLMFGKV